MSVQVHGIERMAPANTRAGSAERCLGCGADVLGPYCHACGERHEGHQIYPFGALLRHLWKHFLDVDRRLLHTLRLILFRPGAATLDFVQGRSRSMVRPFRLYMLLSTIYFLAIAIYQPYAMSPTILLDQMAAQGTLDGFVEKLTARGSSLEVFIERFKVYFNQALSLVFLLSIPAAAVLLKAVYHRRLFHEHFIFSLHFAVFVLAVSLVLLPLEALDSTVYALVPTGIAYVYLGLAMRKAYGGSWVSTGLRLTAVVGGYTVLSFIAMLIAMMGCVVLAIRA